MIAGQITRLILDGEVGEAIALSAANLERLDRVPSAEIALMEPRMQRGGHFGRLATAYEQRFLDMGLETAVLHRRGWDGDGRHQWCGVFPIPDHVAGMGAISTDRQLADFSRYFEHDFHAILLRTRATLAVFPTVRYLTLAAAVRAVEKTHGAKGAILGVMETFPVPDCADPVLVERAFRAAAGQILDSRKAFFLFAESDAIREFLVDCGFSANRVAVNPYPAAHRFEAKQPGIDLAQPLNFGTLGGAREVHNPDLLAAYLIGPSRQLVDWTVRLNVELAAGKLDMDAAELRRALRAAKIDVLEDRLDDASYDRTLQSLDVMLLPYGSRYRTIGSGIFLESLCAGVVPLVPADSTMRRLHLGLGGRAPPIRELTVEGIGVAVDSCARDIESLRDNAREVRQAWLVHEQGPLSWSRRVQEFARSQFRGSS